MIAQHRLLLEQLQDVRHWRELKPKLEKFNTSKTAFTDKNTTAGKIFELFVKYYFLLDPTQSDFVDAWLYQEIPQAIKDKLNLPPSDHGIDILLRDRDNNHIAVQCKFKNDESKVLSWSGDKIANVFGLGTNCTKVIVISNCADVADVAKNLTKEYRQFMNDTLTEISPDTFIRIREALKGNRSPSPIKFQPKEHQKAAIKAVTEHFKTNNRGQLILPCGAGKTLTSLWIKESINSLNTLVLVPSLALIRQIKNEWAKQRSTDYITLFVCSESDIDSGEYDEAVTHTYEIGGNVSTDINEIQSFIARKDEKVIFCTYQSIGAISKSLKSLNSFWFDLVICDEAHRTAGSKAKRTFTMVHDNQKIRAVKRLYMTATPRVVSANMKTRLKDDYKLVCDMSNPATFGTEAFRMSFGEAIDKGILVDYKIIGVGVTDEQIKKFISKREFIEDTTADEVAHNYALDLVMNKYQAFHAISFHSRVKYANEFAQRHAAYFPSVYSNSVNGKQSTTHRQQVLNQFRDSNTGVVSNSRCLTEGVDVPTIDLIYFCDPKTSKIDIVQSSGRALRKDPSGRKTKGYIIVPIFHHISDDIETEIKKQPIFNYLIQVVRSLCDQDERLESEINKIAFGKGKKSKGKLVLEHIDEGSENVIRFEGLERRIRESLFDEVIDKAKSTWEQMFLQLKAYRDKTGHCKVPKKENKQLFYWKATQRQLERKGELDPLKKVKLERLGVNWINFEETGWDLRFNELKKFKATNGHLNVLRNDKEYPGLGYWKYHQGLLYRKGELLPDRIELLQALGFVFDQDSLNHSDRSWLKQFNELKEFYSKKGHTNITVHHYNPTLYNWVKAQRMKYHKGKLKKDRQLKLEAINFLWTAPKENMKNPNVIYDEEAWLTNYKKLVKFKEKEGHCLVKQVNSKEGSLGRWVNDQRVMYHKKNILPHRQELLEKIGFVWNAKELQHKKAWDDKLKELKDFYKINGHFNVGQGGDAKSKSLYYWLYRIRTKGTSLENIIKLKEIDFDVNGIKIKEE